MSGRRYVLQSELHRTLHTVMVSVGPAVALPFSTLLIIIKASGAISQAPISAALALVAALGNCIRVVFARSFRSKSGTNIQRLTVHYVRTRTDNREHLQVIFILVTS